MTNDEITKKDYLLDGQTLDPNPTRARTFILGEIKIPTERLSCTDTERQKLQWQIDMVKRNHPNLTDDEILEWL